jgi:hypothetical protein
MSGRILLLDAPIAAPAQQRAVGGEERRPDRDATLGEARSSFLQRDLEHLAIGHGQCILSDELGLSVT